MSKMTVIQLLNKIANGEEVPKKIHIRDLDKYTWQEDVKAYWSDVDENDLLSDLDLSETNLKEDIDIIQEPQEHKIPKKLPYYSLEKIQKAKNKDEWREERISLLEKRIDDYHNKINEILDYLEEIE